MKSFGSALFIALVIFVSSSLPVFSPLIPQAHAQTKQWTGVCVGNSTDKNNPAYEVATIQGAECLVANVLSVAVTAIALAGFVMIIVGAFFYLTSGGNAKGTESGKNTITFAVIGLVLAISAYIILNLIAQFTGVNAILNFQIPSGDATHYTQF